MHCPGAGSRNGDELSYGGDDNVLKLDCGDSYTAQ